MPFLMNSEALSPEYLWFRGVFGQVALYIIFQILECDMIISPKYLDIQHEPW